MQLDVLAGCLGYGYSLKRCGLISGGSRRVKRPSFRSSFGELTVAESQTARERERREETADRASKMIRGRGLESPEGGVSFPNMEGSTFIRGASGWSLWGWADGRR